MNFGKIANDYIRFAETKGKPQSIRSIRSRIKNYILPYFKDYNIEDITPFIYLDWQSEINKQGFSYKYKKTF